MIIYRPENIVNLYVWEQFKKTNHPFYQAWAQTSGGQGIIPFFPAPANNLPSVLVDNNLPYIVFDKFSRVRSSGALHSIKVDQIRYTISGGSSAQYGNRNLEDTYRDTIEITSKIQKFLDREDYAAQDINEFAGTISDYNNQNYDPTDRYYFHNFNVYQSGFAVNQQDVSDFLNYTPTRDLIIKYEYHSKQYNES